MSRKETVRLRLASPPLQKNSGGDGTSDVVLVLKQKHIPVYGTFLGLNLTIINGESEMPFKFFHAYTYYYKTLS